MADTASGIFKVLLNGENGEAYNISDNDEGLTLGEYVEFVAELAGRKVVYKIEENCSVSKATYALLNIDKIKGIAWIRFIR